MKILSFTYSKGIYSGEAFEEVKLEENIKNCSHFRHRWYSVPFLWQVKKKERRKDTKFGEFVKGLIKSESFEASYLNIRHILQHET